jgi:hypothetical protein
LEVHESNRRRPTGQETGKEVLDPFIREILALPEVELSDGGVPDRSYFPHDRIAKARP